MHGVVRTSTIFVADDGAVYVGGTYMAGALDVDANGTPDVPEATVNPAPKGPADVDMNAFYARLDAAGDVEWIRPVSGAGIQVVGAFTVADNGDLFVLGAYMNDADFDADGEADLEWQSLGSEQVWQYGQDANTFLLRASPSGERCWVRRYTAGGLARRGVPRPVAAGRILHGCARSRPGRRSRVAGHKLLAQRVTQGVAALHRGR